MENELKGRIKERGEIINAITTAAKDAIIFMNHDGHVSYWNDAAEGIFGYKANEIIGKDLHHILAPERFREQYEKGISSFKDTGKGDGVDKVTEYTAVRKNGDEFPIELSLSSVKLHGKWNAIGLVRDISKHKQVEQALYHKHEQLLSIFGNMEEAIYIA
ncbi:MAG: PAS domain-containing protein, partial [Methanosarcinaceae archaeon]